MPPAFDRLRADFFSLETRYEYRATLGRGASGVVFAAFDRMLRCDVAIKVLVLGFDEPEDEALARFKREVQLARRVKHPNVARLHDFGVAGDLPYLTMELVLGRPLWAILEEEGSLPARRAVPILRQVALGTHAAHELGIVHRDLKPQNIMVDASGAVALLDFGLARDLRRGSGLLRDEDLVGTPDYLAPEQLEGRTADARTDVWAIGVVAWRTLAGEHPFSAATPLTLCRAILRAPLPVETLRDAGVPADVAAIVTRCLEKEPSARYAGADELATDLALADLDTLLAEGPEPPPPVEAPGPGEAPRVLVVDDDDATRSVLRHHLEGAGYRVLEAWDGQDALETLQTEDADLVLMDVLMPRLDGFDATRVLKSQPRFARLPVLLMSITADRSRFAFALQTGATDFVSKHESVALLLEKARRLLGRRRP